MVDQEQEGGVQDADPKGGLSNAGRAPGSWRGQLDVEYRKENMNTKVGYEAIGTF